MEKTNLCGRISYDLQPMEGRSSVFTKAIGTLAPESGEHNSSFLVADPAHVGTALAVQHSRPLYTQ